MYFVSLIGIQENPAFARQAATSLREQMRVVFHNRTFLIVLCVNFTTRFILAALITVMPFYADYVLRIGGGELTQLLAMLFAASGVSLLIWQAVIQRFGTRTSMILSMVIAALFAIPLLFAKSLIATLVALGLLGLAVGGTVLGPDLLFAEVVDDDYVRTGLRREGMYRGMLGFIYRFPPALAGLVLGEGLAAAGFDSELKAAEQPAAVGTVIRIFAATLPLAAIVAGVGLLLAYPLYGGRLRDIQDRARLLRQAAQQRHLKNMASSE
jgi:GPH family glycoside/pentoside/hexuronide:cation symporter